MMRTTVLSLLVLGLLAMPAAAQKTPDHMTAQYDALADAILGLHKAEHYTVMTILERHYAMAQGAMNNENYEKAAVEMALFANEGDNAVGGVRKRLIEGGHHHNAAGEEQGLYDEGFVIVTRKAKKKALDAAAAMRQAQGNAARKAAWDAFDAVAQSLLSGD